MRTFVIADSSKRRAKPVAFLLWEPDGSEQGRFSLEALSTCNEADLPLSFAFCARRDCRRATPEESEQWVKSRIVPEDRQNIAEVLMANGLSRYDEVSLFAACQGRSSDDDYLAYEVDLPSRVVDELQASGGLADGRLGQGSARADRVLAAVARRRTEDGVGYAFIGLEDAHDGHEDGVSLGETGLVQKTARHARSDVESAAHRIGELIRARRLELGLTQRQAAARAHITQTVLSRIESGTGNPTLSLLEEVASALDARLDVLLRITKGDSPTAIELRYAGAE